MRFSLIFDELKFLIMASIPEIYTAFLKSSGVCTDTRKLLPGSLFVALSGPNFDGNQYALAALEQGAAFAVVSDPELESNPRCLYVDDTLEALQNLARHHRRQFDIPVLAITGSNGKTTSKELIAQVLKKRFKTHFTKGNFNNHIGVPLTLLAMPSETEFAIIEMGANHQGEIDQLSRIAEPNYGMITNIGKAHLEGFGGIEGVKKGKSELYRFLAETGGTAFVNLDLPFLQDLAEPVDRIVGYSIKGIRGEESFQLSLIESHPLLRFQFQNLAFEDSDPIDVVSHLYGAYNLLNINAAIAIAWHFGIEANKVLDAIQHYKPQNNRSETRFVKQNKVLLDAYNANPSSMQLAIQDFLSSDSPEKYLVLGDMLELGNESEAAHRGILQFLIDQKSQWRGVYLVGPLFFSSQESLALVEADFPSGMHFFEDVQRLKESFDWDQFENAHFFIKGSRGIKLETLLIESDD